MSSTHSTELVSVSLSSRSSSSSSTDAESIELDHQTSRIRIGGAQRNSTTCCGQCCCQPVSSSGLFVLVFTSLLFVAPVLTACVVFFFHECCFYTTRLSWVPTVIGMMTYRTEDRVVWFVFVVCSFLGSLLFGFWICQRWQKWKRAQTIASVSVVSVSTENSRFLPQENGMCFWRGVNWVSIVFGVGYLLCVVWMCGFVVWTGQEQGQGSGQGMEFGFYTSLGCLTSYFVCFVLLEGKFENREGFACWLSCCHACRKRKKKGLSLNADDEESDHEEEIEDETLLDRDRRSTKARLCRGRCSFCTLNRCRNCLSGCRAVLVIGLVLCVVGMIIPYAVFATSGLPKNSLATGGGSGHVVCPNVVTPLETFRERLGPSRVRYASTRPWSKARKVAAESDVAVVFVGVSSCEGIDRDTLSLGNDQDGLIDAVTEVQPNTVVVVNCPGAVLMPWITKPRGVVVVWLPGQEYGHAVTSVLFGDSNPHARLPVTFPRSDTQTPLITKLQYPGIHGNSHYSEGLFIGYRWYDEEGEKPLFPFGHGLSYSKFEYRNLSIGGSILSRDGDPVAVSFRITNVGEVSGKEVYQIYLGFPLVAEKPPQVLVNFGIVSLSPGSQQDVNLDIQFGKLISVWNVTTGSWRVVSGEFQLFVGASSRDIRLSGTFVVDVPSDESVVTMTKEVPVGTDVDLPRTRALALAERMTINDQMALVAGQPGGYMGNVKGLAEFGIPDLALQDGPNGVADFITKATCWPSALSVVATWDVSMMESFAKAMAAEQRLKGSNVLLGPMINLARVPFGGRNFESFGEDPYLAEEMVRSSIPAIQSESIIATAKHFVGNNQEHRRFVVNSIVDERTLHELYMRPFEASVEVGVGSIMCSYNKVNGKHSCENPDLLQTYLKDAMNFEGFVMSDWLATHSTADSVRAGLDMEMPLGFWYSRARLKHALSHDEISADRVKDMAVRILTSLYSVGAMDQSSTGKLSADARSEAHAKLARLLATESTVLMKNDGVLPLVLEQRQVVAVIGDSATQTNPTSMNIYSGLQYLWCALFFFVMLSISLTFMLPSSGCCLSLRCRICRKSEG